jgi:hypothetical protein
MPFELDDARRYVHRIVSLAAAVERVLAGWVRASILF